MYWAPKNNIYANIMICMYTDVNVYIYIYVYMLGLDRDGLVKRRNALDRVIPMRVHLSHSFPFMCAYV